MSTLRFQKNLGTGSESHPYHGDDRPQRPVQTLSADADGQVWWIHLAALLAGVVWAVGWGVATAGAHPTYFTAAQATVEPDGRFRVTLQFDTLAFALNDTSARVGNPPMEALLDGPRADLEKALAGAKNRFVQGFAVTTDRGAGTVATVEFPDAATVLAWKSTADPVLPVVLPVRVTGQLPPGAGSVTFRFPAVFDEVILTLERPGEEPAAEPVESGTASTAWPVRIGVVALREANAAPTQPEPAGLTSWAVGRYVEMGFGHILPEGLDHILFVLGLFLLSTRLRPLFVQITAFTLAHSITLGLSLYGVVRLPPAIVEPLIALSIVVVAVENLRTSRVGAGRTAVVFAFGLLHGLGFAAALNQTGLPRHDFLAATAGFNVGVELGQLAILAAVYPPLRLLQSWPRYRQAVVYPCSIAIAVVAMYWTAQRILLAVHA